MFIVFAGGASAQEIRVGGFLGYASSDIEQACLGLTGEFMIKENMSISPDLILYFPKTQNGVKYSWFEINGNFNYYFVQESKFNLYGQAGLNYTHLKVKTDGGSGTNGELGLNIGFGFDFPVNEKLTPFALMKYTISDYDKALFGAGVKFRVN